VTADRTGRTQRRSGPRKGARPLWFEGLPLPAKLVLATLAAGGGLGLGYLLTLVIGPAILFVVGDRSQPFWLSLRVALIATTAAGASGLAVGYLLAKGRFPGRDLIEAIGSVPIILPPTVLGYYLLQVLGDSPTGRALTGLAGHRLVGSVTGCVIAAAIAAFPFCMRAARASFEGVDARLEQAGRAMGLPGWRVALQVTLPLARRGIAAGLTLGCVRALGEYGATLMVGGDVPGSTRTMSLAVADARTTDETQTLVLILVAMALVAMALLARLGRPQE
jgi:molybdate transport system permease protein